jgi:hypothetical protein
VDDTLKTQMNNFLLSTASQQEIQSLDNKIHETVDTINSLKTSREFFLSFAKVPCFFLHLHRLLLPGFVNCQRIYSFLLRIMGSLFLIFVSLVGYTVL